MSKVIVIALGILLGIATVLSGVNVFLKLKVHQQPITTYVVAPSKIPNTYLGEFEITYYVATGNRTSTGVYPKSDRTIAVDPKVIPYGSIVYIEGVGARIAEDCGSAVKNNVIDVFVDVTQDEALKMGRKKVKVYLIGE